MGERGGAGFGFGSQSDRLGGESIALGLLPRRAISFFRNRFAASSRMATTPSKQKWSEPPRRAAVPPGPSSRCRAICRARRAPPVARVTRTQSSIQPKRGVTPRATRRCEKWRRSPWKGLRPSLRRIRITDVMS